MEVYEEVFCYPSLRCGKEKDRLQEREMGVCDIKHLDLCVNDAVDKEKCMKQNMSADS